MGIQLSLFCQYICVYMLYDGFACATGLHTRTRVQHNQNAPVIPCQRFSPI